jgi:hypothetical protein
MRGVEGVKGKGGSFSPKSLSDFLKGVLAVSLAGGALWGTDVWWSLEPLLLVHVIGQVVCFFGAQSFQYLVLF